MQKSKRKLRPCLLLAVGLALLLAGATSTVAALLRRAEVTAVINDVKLIDPRKGERAAAVQDVVQGDLGVKTGVKSRTELLFQDKTLTRLGERTFFSFNEGTRELELEHGTMLLQVPKGAGGAKIRTAAVTAAIAGTTILLEFSPASALPGAMRHPAGVSNYVATLVPEKCCEELKKPSRQFSRADLGELKRKCKIAEKGFVKVMVLEGTLRLYLNNRVGESVLVKAGEMIILSPNATVIPPAIQFDIARLAETSLLVNNKFWGPAANELALAAVNREIASQARSIEQGDLIKTNLVIYGGGTNVTLTPQDLFAQLDRSQTAKTAVLNATPLEDGSAPPSEDPSSPAPPIGGGNGNPPPSPPDDTGFDIAGSTDLGGEGPPALSPDVSGNAKLVSMLPGVEPTSGSNFLLLSNAGTVGDGDEAPLRTATGASRSLALPVAGGKRALNFDYRFFTDESEPGVSFPDQLEIKLVADGETITYTLDRHTLDPDNDGVPGPVGQENVGGFALGTDWLPFTIDISRFAGKTLTVSFLVVDVEDPVVDSAVAIDSFGTGAYPAGPLAPGFPGRLEMNLDSAVTFGDGAGEFALPNLRGLNARDGVGEAASAGSLFVDAEGAITLNSPLNASTGVNGAGTTFGGTGGTVDFLSRTGTINISSTLKVSEDSTAGAPASASKAAGNIRLESRKPDGVAISISNTGELLALLNAAAPGPGGKIEIVSAGGEIRATGGKVIADRGLVDIRNTGPAGLIHLEAATLSADTLKVGALGVNGQLTIVANSQLSAANTLKLYGGTDAAGKVLFTGAGTVTLSGNPIHIAGKTVEIDGATSVQNNGPTSVHTDNALFGVGVGGGKFQNPVTTGPRSGAPAFD